ncbi:hypothetical protein KEU06_17195 [Pseudaminobacter sp. 19-2017]|uniref:Uncharacterized protein n=1 Tax=Pseudaminobacter soli (ex Zhang et al. 2022) TaxID=2831468 RepID=A0A942DYL9_9HYPH|nr:hypothetical protein [Pseudaminobacter soli]MBS3650354.1 hypothetical protein [Pseudaminobacter soli]
MENRFVFGWSIGATLTARRMVMRSAAVLLRVALCSVSLIGTSALAYSLLPPSIAIAKDGDSGGGGNSGRGGGGGHDSDGRDHDNDGDSSGHGGDDGGDSSGRGGGGDDRDDGKDRGDDRSGRRDGERRDRRDDRIVGRFLDSLKSRGQVVWSSNTRSSIEVRYADGWSERVKGSTYSLTDPRQRSVVTRPARKSDVERLKAAID